MLTNFYAGSDGGMHDVVNGANLGVIKNVINLVDIKHNLERRG
jgi:hypothetical protein